MLTEDGYVAECTGDNIFFASAGVVCTPPAFLGILEGVTRATVIEISGKSYRMKEKACPKLDDNDNQNSH